MALSQKSTRRLLEEANARGFRLVESLDAEARKAVYARGPDEVPKAPDPEAQQTINFLTNRTGRCLTRYLQVHTVIEDTEKCKKMARRYPWHGTDVTKSDHFYFVWFNFTNQCYLFKERVRLFSNEMNELRVAMGDRQCNVTAALKDIDKRLKEYIRHRGSHVHEWHSDHITYSTFAMIDFMHRNYGGAEYAERHKNFYEDSKFEMQYRIDRAVRDMCEIFMGLEDEPDKQLALYLRRFGEYLRNVGAEFPERQRTRGRKPRTS